MRFLLKMFTYTQLCSHSLTLTFTIMQRLALTMFIRPYDRIHAHRRTHYHNHSQGTYWDVLLCLFFWRLIVWCMIYVFLKKKTNTQTHSQQVSTARIHANLASTWKKLEHKGDGLFCLNSVELCCAVLWCHFRYFSVILFPIFSFYFKTFHCFIQTTSQIYLKSIKNLSQTCYFGHGKCQHILV